VGTKIEIKADKKGDLIVSNKVEKEFDITKQQYRQIAGQKKTRPPLLKNIIMAFLSGGLVCLLGQFVQDFFVGMGFSEKEAANPTVAVFIFLAALLTGLGVFDKIARYTGAGTAIPVTGFANSVTATALEFKKEGLVTGIGSKMFMLAGSIIVFGVVTAFIVGLISALI